MDKESIEKVYKYNIFWLLDERSLGDQVTEKIEGAVSRIAKPFVDAVELKRLREKIPNYARGSLIDNLSSLELKKNIQFNLFGSNLLPELINMSKMCVVKDFFRYGGCDDIKLSRPLISFFTTRNNGLKLQYLKNQSVKFEYLSIDYEKVSSSNEKTSKIVEKNKYYFSDFRTISEGFVKSISNHQTM